METCTFCGARIFWQEGIPGAWHKADVEWDEAFRCDGWFHGVHLPAKDADSLMIGRYRTDDEPECDS